MNKMLTFTVHMFFFVLFISISGLVFAENAISKIEAKFLFSDITYDGYDLMSDRYYHSYNSPDGKQQTAFADGTTQDKFWKVDYSGKYCISNRKFENGSCSKVVPLEGGKYKLVKGSKQTHTLSNFSQGDQLN